MIRVSVRSGSPFARAGLEHALEADPRFEIVRESSSSDEPEDVSADVILLDGFKIDTKKARSVSDSAPGPRFVLLAESVPALELRRLVAHGVRSILPRDSAIPEIAAAAEAAAQDLSVFRPEFLEGLLREISERSEIEPGELEEPLTTREMEVLALLAEGAGNKEIAAKLGISENTAKFHVSSILGKLGAATRTEAVSRGYRLGLILI